MVSREWKRASLMLTCLAAAGLLAACGGGSSSNSTTTTTSPTNNVQAISVNGGPVADINYADAAFTSVTVCVPSTTNCATVDGVLVDTGSVGLRILASAIPSLSLPQLSSGGNGYYNCVNFVDGSYLWGPVSQADIELAGEKASSASLQLIEDSAFATPEACSDGGTNEDTLEALGANGILGVGSYPQDCGSVCTSDTSPDIYFTCTTSGDCASATISVAQQVENPIIGFTTDNNGVIIELQSLSSDAASASGNMIFGIGTQSNNALGSASVYTLNDEGFFTTTFNSQTSSVSFLDSGSNGYFFVDSSITPCPDNGPDAAPGWYCPTSTLSLSAQNEGANSTQGTVNFSVDDAVNDFNTGDSALPNLAGTNSSDLCAPETPCGFDWGLPFFFGRNVFVSIEGQSVPSGAPAAPWWAY